MANATLDPSNSSTPPNPSNVTGLLEDIGHDLKTIAADELELVQRKFARYLEQLVAKAGVALLGATVALIGLGMLCMVVVVVLAPIIPPLWLRLLLMAIVYLGLGGGAAYVFARRMLAMHGPDLHKQISEVGETVDAIKHGLSH
jgi:Putative Actinobacterial Holin-X, holin superfamily III